MPVKLTELELAIESMSPDGFIQVTAYLCRQTGQIYYESDDHQEEPLPDDIYDRTKYLPIPSKRDFDLGTPLVFKFVREFMPDDYDFVRNIFSRRGAYGQFKNFLAREHKLDQWHAFENAALTNAIREWCTGNGIDVEE